MNEQKISLKNELNVPKFESICAKIRERQKKIIQEHELLLENSRQTSPSTASFERSVSSSPISIDCCSSEAAVSTGAANTPEPSDTTYSSGIGTSLNNTANSASSNGNNYVNKSGHQVSSLHQKSVTTLKFSIEAILREDFAINSNGLLQLPSSSASTSSSCSAFSTSPHSILCMDENMDISTASGIPQKSSSSTLTSPTSANNFPAWIFCTRYSDRPSSEISDASLAIQKCKNSLSTLPIPVTTDEEKRPRTAFTNAQLERLKQQFLASRYLNEKQRHELAHELGLNESQIKIWFQNKRAKLKKTVVLQRPANFALQLMAAQAQQSLGSKIQGLL